LLDKHINITITTNDKCLIIMLCHNLCQAYMFKVALTQILVDHRALSIVCHVGLHVDFLSMKYSLSLNAFTF
jgi:hypothetical protein